MAPLAFQLIISCSLEPPAMSRATPSKYSYLPLWKLRSNWRYSSTDIGPPGDGSCSHCASYESIDISCVSLHFTFRNTHSTEYIIAIRDCLYGARHIC